ncbi:hypothetical protein, partial [Corynebacterium liangguodongii]|uniref:hypothetical protein n=1 Tax=Corynebacterium liangguodongii TaxID=2079535 RepID=UPI001A9A37D7
RSARHCRRIPSGTSLVFMLQSLVAILEHLSHLKVLRRPVESALHILIRVMDQPSNAFTSAKTSRKGRVQGVAGQRGSHMVL